MDQIHDFVCDEVLSKNEAEKSVVLLGKIRQELCILKISRLPLPTFTAHGKLPLSVRYLHARNDIYSWGTGAVLEDGNVYIECILPATATHIAKYKEGRRLVVTETPAVYEAIVKPYIEAQRGDRLEWVRGILKRGVEAESVLFRDEHFVLLPNSKWDRQSVDTLTLLALIVRNDIASIRDLRAEHIPLLRHIRDQALQLVTKTWSLEPSELKVFFHYHPTFYHLHIHIVNIKNEQSDFGKSILLNTVIDMLETKDMDKHTITYFISEYHELYSLLEENS